MAKKMGYTLMEMLLVLGIFISVTVIVMPYTIQQIQGEKLQDVVKEIESSIFSYQQKGYTGLSSKSYGISFSTNKYTLYIGSTLATAESTEEYPLQNGVTISQISLSGGAIDINFSTGSFRPNHYGSVKVSDYANNYLITISSEGLIDYAKV